MLGNWAIAPPNRPVWAALRTSFASSPRVPGQANSDLPWPIRFWQSAKSLDLNPKELSSKLAQFFARPDSGEDTMDTIEIGGPDRVASRVALGTWAEADKCEIDDILTRNIVYPVGPDFIAPPAAAADRGVA